MKLRHLLVALAAASPLLALDPPDSIHSTASPFVGISPGSMVSIFFFRNPPFLSVDASKLKLTFEPVTNREPIAGGRMIVVSHFEIRTVIPKEVPVGELIVRIMRDGLPFILIQTRIQPAAPAIFAANSAGIGPALAQNYRSGAASLNSLTNPALLGQDVTLWLTGLGNFAPGDVTVLVAGLSAPITYVAHHATPGLDQINVRLPANSELGCYVPVMVRVGTIESNQATLAINSSAGVCAHPLGLSYSEMQTLDAGGTILGGDIGFLGTMNLAADPPFFGTESAEFIERTADEVFRLAQPQVPFSADTACQSSSYMLVPFAFFGRRRADLGPTVVFDGPSAERFVVPNSSLSYSGEPYAGKKSPFTPGTWQFSAPGGADVQRFQGSFSLPPLIAWKNAPQTAVVPRTRDLEVTWDTAGYAPEDTVRVTLSALPKIVECTAFAWRGQVRLPAELLQTLEGGAGELSLQVTPYSALRKMFTLTRTTGEPVRAVVNYFFSESRPVTIQ